MAISVVFSIAHATFLTVVVASMIACHPEASKRNVGDEGSVRGDAHGGGSGTDEGATTEGGTSSIHMYAGKEYCDHFVSKTLSAYDDAALYPNPAEHPPLRFDELERIAREAGTIDATLERLAAEYPDFMKNWVPVFGQLAAQHGSLDRPRIVVYGDGSFVLSFSADPDLLGSERVETIALVPEDPTLAPEEDTGRWLLRSITYPDQSDIGGPASTEEPLRSADNPEECLACHAFDAAPSLRLEDRVHPLWFTYSLYATSDFRGEGAARQAVTKFFAQASELRRYRRLPGIEERAKQVNPGADDSARIDRYLVEWNMRRLARRIVRHERFEEMLPALVAAVYDCPEFEELVPRDAAERLEDEARTSVAHLERMESSILAALEDERTRFRDEMYDAVRVAIVEAGEHVDREPLKALERETWVWLLAAKHLKVMVCRQLQEATHADPTCHGNGHPDEMRSSIVSKVRAILEAGMGIPLAAYSMYPLSPGITPHIATMDFRPYAFTVNLNVDHLFPLYMHVLQAMHDRGGRHRDLAGALGCLPKKMTGDTDGENHSAGMQMCDRAARLRDGTI